MLRLQAAGCGTDSVFSPREQPKQVLSARGQKLFFDSSDSPEQMARGSPDQAGTANSTTHTNQNVPINRGTVKEFQTIQSHVDPRSPRVQVALSKGTEHLADDCLVATTPTVSSESSSIVSWSRRVGAASVKSSTKGHKLFFNGRRRRKGLGQQILPDEVGFDQMGGSGHSAFSGGTEGKLRQERIFENLSRTDTAASSISLHSRQPLTISTADEGPRAEYAGVDGALDGFGDGDLGEQEAATAFEEGGNRADPASPGAASGHNDRQLTAQKTAVKALLSGREQ
jgi:hypothetical protein